jgi:hypothetical protein
MIMMIESRTNVAGKEVATVLGRLLLKAAAQKYGYVEQEVAPPKTLIKATWNHRSRPTR